MAKQHRSTATLDDLASDLEAAAKPATLDDLASDLDVVVEDKPKQKNNEAKDKSGVKPLPAFVVLKSFFVTHVPLVGHSEVYTAREFLAGQRVVSPKDIMFLIEHNVDLEYPKDYEF